MKKYNLDISFAQINRVFPFHIIIDSSSNIISLGKSNLKMGIEGISDSFKNVFTFERPFLESFDFKKLKDLSNELVYLKCINIPSIILRGQFEFFAEEQVIVFLGSPLFSRIENLKENNLNINDFANFDPLLDMLHIMKSQEITTDEIKELLINVSDQKKKTDQYNKQLKLFQSFLDSASDGIQVAKVDGSLFYINNEASSRLGIEMENVQKYSVKDFEKTFEDESVWDAHIEDLRENDKIILEGINSHQSTGDSFPVEVTVKLANIENEEYIIANSRDITERKAIESRLVKQDKKFRNIIANMNLGLLEVDLSGEILFANQSFADISGYDLDELKGMKSEQVLGLEAGEEIDSEISNNAASNAFEIQVKNKNGEKRWWFKSSAPNLNKAGEHIGNIVIYLDITEQKTLEKQLELAKDLAEEGSKAKDAFLANMSHEIRTPLNAIIGMIRELKKENLSTTQETYLGHTDSASRHLLSIVNNILDMSKIEAGEFRLENHHFSIEALVGNIQSILLNKAKQKDIDFRYHIDRSIFQAHKGDSVRLRQVLINLIDNAIKFTESGYVDLHVDVVKTENNKQHFRFVLTDTGVGMNKDYLDQLFSKFSQEELSTNRKYGGTGLGMTITRNIILLMGGEIDVWSEKNKGTKITIELSFEKGETEKLIENDIESFSDGLKGVKVLLVEDNAMNRLIAMKSLEYFGCITEEAENGKVALEQLNKEEFDLILMDIQMPEMDGVETTQKIRKDADSQIPIIALTANAFRKDIDHYLSIGMNDYVSKPFQEAELFNAIQNHVANVNLQTNPTNTMEEHSYDLSKLNEVSKGNQSFIEKMVGIFIESIPQALDDMVIALKEKDHVQVSKLAHRIKPNIDYLGMESIHLMAKDIELLGLSEDVSHAVLEEKVHEMRHSLLNVIEKLKEEFA